MALKILRDKDICTYRAFAAASAANNHSFNTSTDDHKPVYWGTEGRKVDSYGLNQVLGIDSESIARHFKNKLPEEFRNDAESYLSKELGEDMLDGKISAKDMIDMVRDQPFIINLLVPYIRDCSMKNGICGIQECLPPHLMDRYALQIIEMHMNRNDGYKGDSYRGIGMQTTDSEYYTELIFIDIPSEATPEKDGSFTLTPKGNARSKQKVKLTESNSLTKIQNEFAVNVLPTLASNRIALKDGIDNRMLADLRSQTCYSADTLCVEL